MAGLGDLFGRNGVIEQLLLWAVLNQVISTTASPALTALQQDVNAAHPEQVLDAVTLAELLARHMITPGQAVADAAKSGIDGQRFAQLADLHKVRLQPGDLATAVLRSYLTLGDAEKVAAQLGIDAAQFAVLTDLAGDALGPQQLAEARRRGLIPAAGTGAKSVSYEQGIAESRLHNKWGPILYDLTKMLLSAPEAASAVVRNFMPLGEAAQLVERQGVDAATFQIMTHLAADAPGPQQLAEALRRGLIPLDGTGPGAVSFMQGIAEGRLADKWAPVIQGLSRLWPTPTDALDAQVKGQLTDTEAAALYEQLGGDPQFREWLYNSIGEGPTPLEAAAMAARGIIDWQGSGPASTSYEQAVKESHYRNKWTGAYRALSHYLPAPGEIITFLAHGAISHDRAVQLLSKHDLDADVLAAYLSEAELTALSDYRGLTQTAVVDMYYGHLIDRGQAIDLLGLLHVTAKAADLLLAYADMRQVIDSINRSVQRIAQLFTGRKIGTDTASQALYGLGIPAASVEQLIQTWEIQAAANVKVLTQSEIVNAFYYSIFDLPTALDELQAIGYTQYDAWVLLSLKAKGPLPGQPPRNVAVSPGAPIPGVT